MHSLLDGFLMTLDLNQRSPKTLATYRTYLTPWSEVRDSRDLRSSLAAHLRRYENPTSRYTAWTHIRAFEKWCIAEGFCDDWLRGIKIRKPPPPQREILTPAEFEHVMRCMPKTLHGRRDRALFSLIYYTGARRTAIVRARLLDLNLKDRLIRVRTKGDKEELLTIARPGALSVALWLPLLESQWLFPSITRGNRQRDRPVHPDQVTHLFPRYAAAAGITKRAWVHGLRHSHAQHLRDEGESLDIIAAALGITLEAAQIYARTSKAHVRAAQDRVFV